MRPLSLLLGFFLRFVLSDLLWGCEPVCPTASPTDVHPHISDHIQTDSSWFLPESLPVSIQNLTKGLLTLNGTYGLMILEAGSDFNTQWTLSSPTQTVGISGLSSSKTPSFQFVQLADGIFSIDSSLYSNSQKGIVLASPAASISYKIQKGQSDCELDGLIFAVIAWDTSMQSKLPRDINFLVTSQCTYCSSLPLSDKFVKICPKVETLPTREYTEGTTVAATSASTVELTTASTTMETTTTTTTTKTAVSTTSTTSTTAPITTTTATTVPTTRTSITTSTTTQRTAFPTTTSTATITTPTTATTTIATTTPTTTTGTTSATSTEVTTPTTNKKHRAVFRNDLKGIQLVYKGTPPLGIVDCAQILLDLKALGKSPSCNGDGRTVDISFGPGATVVPGNKLILKSSTGNVDLLVEEASSPTSPIFFVDYNKALMSCEDILKFTIKQLAGTGDRNATFQWSVIEGPPLNDTIQQSKDSREIVLPTNTIKDILTLNVTVCNFAGKCTNSGALTVTRNNSTEALSLEIEGIPEVVYPSMGLKLDAIAKYSSCEGVFPAREAVYNWSVNGSELFESSYRIPSYQYLVHESVPIKLTASYKDPKTEKLFTTETTAEITYSPEKLVLTIDAARKTHPSDVELRVDASASRDPNSAHSILQHSWSCLNITSNSSCKLPSDLITRSSTLLLPAGTLDTGGQFLFTDTIESTLGQKGSVSSLVIITAPLLPSVTVVPLAYPKQSIHEYIRLLALVSSEEAPTNVTWQVIKARGYGFFNLKDFLSENNIHFDIPSNGRKMMASLTIPPRVDPSWAGLSFDSKYLLRITATNAKGSSSADVELVTEDELPQGAVEVSPATNLTGLSSAITFRLGDGWSNLDFPVSYRFGYRILLVKNESTVEWLPHSSANSVELVLPSGGLHSPSCAKRIGYTAMVEACDRSGACRVAESSPFYISSPKNITLAMNDVVTKINDDIINGKHLDSVQKILAIQMEGCENQIEASVADRSALALLDSLSSQSDITEWKEVLEATSDVLPSVSDEVLVAVQPVLQKYRHKIGMGDSSRQKREANAGAVMNITNNAATETDAAGMLEMYDILLIRNQSIVDVYLNNIDDYLSAFCLQLDEKSTRIMTAEGPNGFTVIQSQTANPNIANFLNQTFTTAGGASPLKFLDMFTTIFKEWTCGNSFFCTHACLATARILPAALQANVYLENRFYPDRAPISTNDSVSVFYKVSIVDPTTGNTASQFMSLAPLYSIKIPIDGFSPVNYYACFIFSDTTQAWDVTGCTSSSFATKIAGINHITCNCSSSGYIGVFTQPPPLPPPIWQHSEVRISFLLNTSILPTEPQMRVFKDNIAVSGQSGRLVDWTTEKTNDSRVMVNVTLRPPFKPTQITSDYALQAILRVVAPGSGFVAYDEMKVASYFYQMVDRPLVGDGNARKIIVRMLDKLYSQVVGNKSDTLPTQWTNIMADTLRISSYRFKNAGIFMGIFFNVTITKPFEEEKYPLSAEEISLMLVESTKYKEIQVVSAAGENINLPEILFNRDVVELQVIQQQNPLVTILVVAISSGVAITSLFIGGAIVVKVRTDRCLEEERRRVVMVDPADFNAPPRYGEAVQGGGPGRQRSDVIRSRHR